MAIEVVKVTYDGDSSYGYRYEGKVYEIGGIGITPDITPAKLKDAITRGDTTEKSVTEFLPTPQAFLDDAQIEVVDQF